MRKKLLASVMTVVVSAMVLAGCTSTGQPESTVTDAVQEAQQDASAQQEASNEQLSEPETKEEPKAEAALEDGVYSAKFTTDSSMFHINEAYGDRGTLTVKDGEMTLHITLPSKNVVNLFPGKAEDAQKDGAVLLEPTTDPVKYDDGTEEEVYGFDVPVPYLEEEFDLALIGKKGTWYDHKVTVSNPVAE